MDGATRSDARTQVSVIMPVYNAEATMRRSIESVLGQTHADVQLVLVDDGSRDGSAAIIADYAARDSRVTAIHQANGGVAAARNAGLRAATGTHVAFCDSDDWWAPHKLELQLEQMRASDALVCYAAYQRVAEDGRPLSRVLPPLRVEYRDMLGSNHIGNLTGVYDRRLGDIEFQRVGHEDYVFWLDRVRRAGVAVRVPGDEPLAWYLVRGGSVSANKLRAAGWQWQIYRQNEGLGVSRACWYMLQYVRHALLKRKPVVG
ncbi:MAG TPA: glycosyltransferase family 2 protein [Pseudoxanthomonas sp.]|jgi:glycosyltransferase involved in cell wall biosynthesis|nr:glycosyltransferase family 2 protein [Pseudoxanthomonas sp.]